MGAGISLVAPLLHPCKGVWSASVAPNRVFCVNSDSAGFYRETQGAIPQAGVAPGTHLRKAL